MITDRTLDETLVELLRCQRALEALRKARKTAASERNDGEVAGYAIDRLCVKEHAAAKRSSMDLTRKLAALRAGR